MHRLVRISPFDSQKRRHTSFALVEVMPEVPEDAAIEIDEDDLRVDTYRAVGRRRPARQQDRFGGAHHAPADRDRGHLPERAQPDPEPGAGDGGAARQAGGARSRRSARPRWPACEGEHVEAGWGNQIRSYVLQPYTMVKDLRTGVETSNPSAVLDGDLDAFIEGYLRSRIGSEVASRHDRHARAAAPYRARTDAPSR